MMLLNNGNIEVLEGDSMGERLDQFKKDLKLVRVVAITYTLGLAFYGAIVLIAIYIFKLMKSLWFTILLKEFEHSSNQLTMNNTTDSQK